MTLHQMNPPSWLFYQVPESAGRVLNVGLFLTRDEKKVSW